MRSDSSAFDDFFRCNFAAVVAFLVKAGFGAEEAHDATAEGMACAYERWSEISNARAWLYRTALRIAVAQENRLRDGIKRAMAASGATPDSWSDPYSAVDNQLDLLSMLATLPKQQRLVMAWHMHGFTKRDIAEYLHISEATVRSHIRHARERIRTLWENDQGRQTDISVRRNGSQLGGV